MRKVMNGKVETFVLFGEQFSHENMYVTTVFGIAGLWDLDRDGVLEIITHDAYYEGFGFGIYSFEDGEFIYRTGWEMGV